MLSFSLDYYYCYAYKMSNTPPDDDDAAAAAVYAYT